MRSRVHFTRATRQRANAPTRERRLGQALTEFALAAPIFFALVLLTFEGGRLYFTWTCVTEASREGARTAILGSTTSTTPIVNAALGLTSWTGVTSANVAVARNGSKVSGSFTKQRGDVMTVTINFTYTVTIAQTLGSGWPGLPFASLPITVRTQMRAEG
jgi:Flp pilus assembly protein TadG